MQIDVVIKLKERINLWLSGRKNTYLFIVGYFYSITFIGIGIIIIEKPDLLFVCLQWFY